MCLQSLELSLQSLCDSPNPCQQRLTRAEEGPFCCGWSAEGRANSLPHQGVWGSTRVPLGRLGAGSTGAARSAAPPPLLPGCELSAWFPPVEREVGRAGECNKPITPPHLQDPCVWGVGVTWPYMVWDRLLIPASWETPGSSQLFEASSTHKVRMALCCGSVCGGSQHFRQRTLFKGDTWLHCANGPPPSSRGFSVVTLMSAWGSPSFTAFGWGSLAQMSSSALWWSFF